MLPETQKILNKFYQLNKELFSDAVNDFKPSNHSYGEFEEINKIYASISSLRQDIRTRLFAGNYDLEYVTPKQILTDIDVEKQFIDEEIKELEGYIKKYENLKSDVPQPILKTIEYYRALQETLTYVLTLSEIFEARNPGQILDLKLKNIGLQGQIKLGEEINKAYRYLGLYMLLSAVIIISVFYLNGRGKSYQFAAALLVIIPILDSWISKKRLPHFIKLIFSKNYRLIFLKNIIEKLKPE